MKGPIRVTTRRLDSDDPPTTRYYIMDKKPMSTREVVGYFVFAVLLLLVGIAII